MRLELYWAHTGAFPRGMPRSPHALMPFRIWGVRQGMAEVAYADEAVRGAAGDWLVLPGLVQRQRIAPGTVISSIAIESPTPEGAGLLRAIGPRCMPKAATGLTETADGLLAWSEAHAVHLPNQRMRLLPVTAAACGDLQALLCRLAGALAEFAPGPLLGASPDPRLRRLWTTLATHAAAPFPPVAMMETCVGLGWRRLEQLCRRDWGQSPREIHQRMRLDEALRRLDADDQPVKAVARALGFASADRFSHWLRRTTGRSPQHWRRQSRP